MTLITFEVLTPEFRKKAVDKINEKFTVASFRDMAHARKRETAQAITNGASLSGDHPFVVEATLRGLTTDEFAANIVTKGDNIQQREMHRQRFLITVENAKTVKEIEEVLLEVGKF